MSACKHGWASENYVKCPRCYEEARHAAEAATLTARIGVLEEALRRVVECGSCYGAPDCWGRYKCPWCEARAALSASPEEDKP